MRCPTCSHDQPRSGGMVCSACGYHFALDPKQPPRIADGRFTRAVARVSDDGRRWYSIEQLHATLVNRPRGVAGTMVAAAIVGVIIGWIGFGAVEAADSLDVTTRQVLAVCVALAIVGVLGVGWWLAHRTAPLEQTRRLVHRWQAAGKRLDRLVERPNLDRPVPSAPESDIFDYGAEAVLVVDDELAVDLLVGNGFPTEHRCLVVSARGYPAAVAERAAALLASAPSTPVGLLHASDGAGALADATARYGPGVVDLGLPEDAARHLPGLRWARRAPTVPVRALPHRVLFRAVPVALAERTALVPLVASIRSGSYGGGGFDGDADDFG